MDEYTQDPGGDVKAAHGGSALHPIGHHPDHAAGADGSVAPRLAEIPNAAMAVAAAAESAAPAEPDDPACVPEGLKGAKGSHDEHLEDAPPEPWRPVGCELAHYNYRSAAGELLYDVVRYHPKRFRQRRPDPENPRGWLNGIAGVQRVLYRLPELLAVDPEAPVFVVEGEKDVDNLHAVTLIATCNPIGAGKWRDEYSLALVGRYVIVVPDNDEPGRKHALQVARSVALHARTVKNLTLPGVPPKGDVSGFLDAGHTAAELLSLAAAPTFDLERPRPAPAETRRERGQAEAGSPQAPRQGGGAGGHGGGVHRVRRRTRPGDHRNLPFERVVGVPCVRPQG